MKRRKASCIDHILRRNCLLKYIIEVKIERRIEVTGRRGRRCKLLLYDNKTIGYWTLKEEAVDRTLWRTGFGRGYGKGEGKGKFHPITGHEGPEVE